MRIELLALDVDGTLATSDLTITEPTKKTIAKAIDQGVLVVPATGRVFKQVPEEVLEIPGMQYAITSNGAAVTDLKSMEQIYTNPLKKEVVEKIAELLYNRTLYVEAYIGGKSITYGRSLDLAKKKMPKEYVDLIVSTIDVEPKEKDFYDYILRKPVEKINLFFESRQDRLNMISELERAVADESKITSPVIDNVEINNPNASKGDALSHLADLLAIPSQRVMAVGDADNDIEMIRYAGLGIAMENADEDLKRIADEMTLSNDEDGVAHAISTYILKKKER
ncbi:MAG: HAD family phosphatase [Eubacteriaceae bacterium]|nr:HAD family phosphatase [Eubacteriaceae bacterium]